MIEKTLYVCQICNTEYSDKKKAIECEKNHKKIEDAVIVGSYRSKNSIEDGAPVKIEIKFKDSDKWITYKR